MPPGTDPIKLLHVFNLSMVGYFGIGGAQILDGQPANIIIAGQSGKSLELFSGNPQKVFNWQRPVCSANDEAARDAAPSCRKRIRRPFRNLNWQVRNIPSGFYRRGT